MGRTRTDDTHRVGVGMNLINETIVIPITHHLTVRHPRQHLDQ
jgi:hypothetical protein